MSCRATRVHERIGRCDLLAAALTSLTMLQWSVPASVDLFAEPFHGVQFIQKVIGKEFALSEVEDRAVSTKPKHHSLPSSSCTASAAPRLSHKKSTSILVASSSFVVSPDITDSFQSGSRCTGCGSLTKQCGVHIEIHYVHNVNFASYQ